MGLRLARLGYRNGVLDSHTFEEATTQFMNWLRQRARWIKGFMQTWLVHMRNPLRATRELGLAGFWILQAFTAGIFVSALFHPFFIAVTLWYLASGPLNPSFLLKVLNCLNLGLFALGYCVTMLAGCIALRKRGLGVGGLPSQPCLFTGFSSPWPPGSPCGNLYLRPSPGIKPSTAGRSFRNNIDWSGRRESNPRHAAWEATVLPLNYARVGVMLVCGLLRV